jgi:hypothetical protein
MPRTTTLDLSDLYLEYGSHAAPEDGMCMMEATAMLAGEKHTYHPACVSPLLARVGIRLNDLATDTQRQDLKQFIPHIVDTAGDGQDEARCWLAVDRSVRGVLPKYLDRLDCREEAATLRALPPITSRATYLPHVWLLGTLADEMRKLHSKRRSEIHRAMYKALKSQPVAASAIASAIAVAVADSVADADAVDSWQTTYSAAYDMVKPIYQRKCADLIAESWGDAMALYADLIDPGAVMA